MTILSAMMLAGCAGSYDKSAIPDAAATMRQAMATCDKEQTAAKITACAVAAQHDFAVAIHLPKMDAFNAYAAQMMTLAADWDAGRISPKQMNARAASIRYDYWFACNCGLGARDRGSFGYEIVPSSNLMPPGVQLGPTPP
ncbi:MAG TPA: hypothetical protein VFI23_03675 [Rhizomicrobium sp.]|nr:hypothetical protein [Rhizomicrobium sp.]